jgi:hypothetical protein
MKPSTLLIVSAIFLSFLMNAQDTDLLTGWGVGVQGGVNWNSKKILAPYSISNLPQTFIRREFDPNTYTVKESQKPVSLTGGLAVFYRNEDFPWVSGQADLIFSNVRTGYEYEDIEGLKYNLDFSYWYSSLAISPKLNPLATANSILLQGIFLRIGIQIGLNLNSDHLTYRHEPENIWGNSGYIERELQAITKGQADFGFFGGLGWEIPLGDNIGINVEAKYYHGTADVIQGKPNSYGFDWTIDNYIRSLQGTVGLFFKFPNQ